jgi:hypothetical protein
MIPGRGGHRFVGPALEAAPFAFSSVQASAHSGRPQASPLQELLVNDFAPYNGHFHAQIFDFFRRYLE